MGSRWQRIIDVKRGVIGQALKQRSLDQASIISLSACGIDWRINGPNKRLKARARGSRVCIMHSRARARSGDE